MDPRICEKKKHDRDRDLLRVGVASESEREGGDELFFLVHIALY